MERQDLKYRRNDLQDLLKPLERDSTVDRVAQAIREGIIEGRLEQGTQLRIAALAEMLGTSQGSVREAIRELVSEGLVEHEPHRGSFVRRRPLSDSLDVYLAREAIETWAIRRAVARCGEVDLSQLENAVAAMVSAQHDPGESVLNADMAFHHSLVELAGCERLTAMHATLIAETKILLHQHSPWPGTSYGPLHLEILETIRRGDESAVDLLTEHLRTAAERIAGRHLGDEGS